MASDSTFRVPVECGHCKRSFSCEVPAAGRYQLDCPWCDHQVEFMFAGIVEIR